jgi:hypothetical protein
MHVGRLRDAPEEIATHQIDRICTPRLISTEGLLTAPNSGYRMSRDQAAITACDDGPA